MSPQLITLDQLFPPWRAISDKYDSLCEEALKQYPSPTEAQRKIESIMWEYEGFEAILFLLVNLGLSFETSVDHLQRIIKTNDGIEKEIDFSIVISGKEVHFGVTSFTDSDNDLHKDVEPVSIEINDLKYPDGAVSDTATISSVRSHRNYLSRRLAVRVATEGRHHLNTDYVYIAFPKANPGFGGGLDAISKEFDFGASDYTFKQNGISGLIVIGEYLRIDPKKKSIEPDVILVKTMAFPHASETVKDFLSRIDNATINQKARNEEIRRLVTSPQPKHPPTA